MAAPISHRPRPPSKITRFQTLANNAHFRKHVLSPRRFRCQHYAACRASHPGTFYEGQLHHVGAHYDLFLNNLPLRILVVGQEYGHAPARVSLGARADMMRRFAHEYRFYAEPGFPGRNPHLRGTTVLLRLLLGGRAGPDYEGEFVELPSGPVHIFECFALANFLLCSAVAEPSGERFSGGQRGWRPPRCGRTARRTFDGR